MILPIYFLEKNIPPEIITFVVGITAAPIIIKFFWGGIVDYFARFGRKIFILIGGLLSIISLLFLAYFDPGTAMLSFTIFLLLTYVGISFLDVSADAWAIEISKKNERGKINGAMYAGQNVGMAFGALVLPFFVLIFDYSAIFHISAFIIFFILLFPLFVKEKITVKKRQNIIKILICEFNKKKMIIAAFFSITFALSAGMLLFIVPLYMDISLQLDLTQIGFITMVFTIAIAIGAIVGGGLSDKWGRKNTIGFLFIISIIFTILLVFLKDWYNFFVIYVIIGFLQGGYTSTALAFFMDITNPKIGATQFSIFMGLGNLGNIGIASASGMLYVLLSFDQVFLYAAWLFGPALLLLYFIKEKNYKNYE